MQHEYARIAVTLDNGEMGFLSFVTLGRGNILPPGAHWENIQTGWWRRDATDAHVFDFVMRMYPEVDSLGNPLPQPARMREISEEEFQAVQADRTYRDARRDDGEFIDHDMTKAREIHLARLRHVRGPALDKLDRDWMRATGQGKKAEVARIEAERQALRDLPVTLGVEAAKTVEELKERWPPSLG